MYIDKKSNDEVWFEINFLYFKEANCDINLNKDFQKYNSLLDLKRKIRFYINEYNYFSDISRVFIYKYKNGKKTWSKVFNAQSDEFFDFINHRTKAEIIQEQKEVFEPTSEHFKKSCENFKKEDGYQDYCEVLKKLGKE